MPGRNFIGVHLEIGLFACSLGVDWALVRGSSISLVLVVRPFCRILLCERRGPLRLSRGVLTMPYRTVFRFLKS